MVISNSGIYDTLTLCELDNQRDLVINNAICTIECVSPECVFPSYHKSYDSECLSDETFTAKCCDSNTLAINQFYKWYMENGKFVDNAFTFSGYTIDFRKNKIDILNIKADRKEYERKLNNFWYKYCRR